MEEAISDIPGDIMNLRRLTSAAVASAVLLTLGSTPADAAGPVRLGRIQYDSPGTDTRSNRSLNAESVTIVNRGRQARVLTGWTLRDTAGHVFRFPRFTLRPGRSVQVHTGRGRNDGNDLFWRMGNYVWNNTGDRATLRTARGKVVDRCRWGDGPGVKVC